MAAHDVTTDVDTVSQADGSGSAETKSPLAWALGGLVLLVVATWAADKLSVKFSKHPTEVFTPTTPYVALAGVILMSAAAERIGDILGWWWGAKPSAAIKDAGKLAKTERSTPLSEDNHPPAMQLGSAIDALPRFVGVRQARAIASDALAIANAPSTDTRSPAKPSQASKDAAKKVAAAASAAADSAALSRPTIAFPLAALATIACAYLGVFALHALSTASTLGSSPMAFAIDALITGLIVSGGTKFVHDTLSMLTAPKASKADT